MQTLVPCPSCGRHVQAKEASCPFCTSVLPANLASRAVPAATRRMSRVAAFSFAAVVAGAGVAATAGCTTDTSDSSDEDPYESEDELKKKKCCDPSVKPPNGREGVWCCGDGSWQYDIGSGNQTKSCKGHNGKGLVCKATGCAAHE